MAEAITSLQNRRIKDLVALSEKSRLRREKMVFTVEGRREVSRCMAAGFQVLEIYWCPDLVDAGEVDSLLAGSPAAGAVRPEIFEVSQAVYSKIAYRESTEGMVAVVRCREHSLENLQVGENPLVVVLESVEKPGNLGAILRTADAAGVSAVIVCDPLCDLYNPNLLRASTGGIFTVPVAVCSSEEAVTWLRAHSVQILTAQLQDSSPYYDIDFVRGTAVVFGTEATGLSDYWRAQADRHVIIPMLGRLDSLNVATSVAILCYEAVRQRINKK